MAFWDLACTWRRYLVFLIQGLCACSLAMLYLFVGLVLYSGYYVYPTRTRPPPRSQAPLGEQSTTFLPSPIAEDDPPAIPETACVDFDTSFNPPHHPRFFNGRPLVLQENDRPLIIPKIVVQDFSAEDGSASYKAMEYNLAEPLKRKKRLSWVRVSTTLRDHLPPNTRPSSLGFPPTATVSTAGGLRPLYLVEGFKRRQSDASVQKLLEFPGRKRVLGTTVAKDGSFVIVGL